MWSTACGGLRREGFLPALYDQASLVCFGLSEEMHRRGLYRSHACMPYIHNAGLKQVLFCRSTKGITAAGSTFRVYLQMTWE